MCVSLGNTQEPSPCVILLFCLFAKKHAIIVLLHNEDLSCMGEHITMKALISSVRRNSLGAVLGIKAGEKICRINGIIPIDLIELSYLVIDDKLILEIEDADGSCRQLTVDKGLDEDLGLSFETAVFDGIKFCCNRCVFCFVDQMMPGMRSSLYNKDDDFRLSFLYGNFLTLTNLSEQEFERILTEHLSPLYVSVHATDPAVRINMMKNKRAGEILPLLERLVDGGIHIHTQIVLCPGYNDGPILEKTFRDLLKMRPAIETMAVVPVGLTKHRETLAELRLFTTEEARSIIRQAERWQAECRKSFGKSFIYLGDEFYLKAGLPLPEAEYYDGFPQIENGIGLSRNFLDEWQQTKKAFVKGGRMNKTLIPVGTSAYLILQPLLAEFNEAMGTEHLFVPIDNNFFGTLINVTGLLTSVDILAQVAAYPDYERIILPRSVLNNDFLFLDNSSLADFKKAFHGEVHYAAGAAELKALLV